MKCTPEEAAAMAEKIFEPDCFNAEEIARLIDLAREPLQVEIYRVTAGWREAFDLGIAHQDRAKALEEDTKKHVALYQTALDLAEKLQKKRDALAAQVAELREALIYHQEQTRPIYQTQEILASTTPALLPNPAPVRTNGHRIPNHPSQGTDTMINGTPIESTNLKQAAWYLGDLYIEFHNKGNPRSYRYPNVDESVFQDLIAAESKGKYFHQHISKLDFDELNYNPFS